MPGGRSPLTNALHHLDGGFAQRRGVKPFHDLEMEVAGVRLRLTLRADDDVDRSAGGRGRLDVCHT
jgi:hypothetical protein